MATQAMLDAAKELDGIEAKVGLAAGFVAGLIEERDDWSFVVKINVVLEAALNAVLAEVSPGHDLSGFVGQLALQGRSGKLALAVAAGIIDSKCVEAFGALATIRNRFVHSLAGLSGTLDNYAAQMTLEQRIDFLRKTYHADPEDVPKFREESLEAFAGQFRERIWWCAACLLITLCAGDQQNEIRALTFKLGELRPRLPEQPVAEPNALARLFAESKK